MSQQWQPSQYDQGHDPHRWYAEQQRIAAAQRSFVTPAVIVLVLYFVLWLPGFIANIVYLASARDTQRITGNAPEGKGCLISLLVVWVGLALLGCVFLVSIVAGTETSTS